MLAASLALALLAPRTNLPPGCTPPKPAHCGTYDLIMASDFARQMRRFAGNRRGNVVTMESPYLHRQFVRALGVFNITDKPTPIAPGLSMIKGCVPHNCTDRGAVILSDNGEVQAVGIAQSHVRPRHDELDVFVARGGVHNRPIMRAVREWAWSSRGTYSIPTDRVRIHFMREGKTKTVVIP